MAALEKLEEVHEERIQSGIDKQDDSRVSSQKVRETRIQIEETIGINQDSEQDKQLEDLLNQIRKVENEIIELLELQNKVDKNKSYKERKEKLLQELISDVEELKTKVDKLKSEIESMLNHVDELDEEKELKERKIRDQETLIKQLEAELRELRQKLKDMEGLSIEGFTDAEILDLREILDRVNKEIEKLKNKQRKQDEYYSVRKNELLEKEKYIMELRRQLQDLDDGESVTPQPVSAINMDVVDELDRLMLDYLRKWNCNVPITRMGNGYYLFGTRKIYAKILNGKLVIRVGGGYMIITEFLDQYSEIELNKIDRLMEREKVNRYEDIEIVKSHLKPIWDEKERSFKRRQKSHSRSPTYKKSTQEKV